LQKSWDTKLVNAIKDKEVITGLPNHFTNVGSFEDGIPIIQLSKCIHFTKYQVFWSKTFSFSKAWKHSRFFNNKNLLGGTDLLITLELIKTGHRFACLENGILEYVIKPAYWTRSQNSALASRYCIDFVKLHMPLDKLGLFPKLKEYSILGIVDEQDKKEIESKYGNYLDYLYVKDLRVFKQ
jgi:hypothetical protein